MYYRYDNVAQTCDSVEIPRADTTSSTIQETQQIRY